MYINPLAIGSARYGGLAEVLRVMDAGLSDTNGVASDRPCAVNAERKRAYLALVENSYDKGAATAADDLIRKAFRKPAIACAATGITVLSAAGSAFMRGYLDMIGLLSAAAS